MATVSGDGPSAVSRRYPSVGGWHLLASATAGPVARRGGFGFIATMEGGDVCRVMGCTSLEPLGHLCWWPQDLVATLLLPPHLIDGGSWVASTTSACSPPTLTNPTFFGHAGMHAAVLQSSVRGGGA
jgi:hypothetical protein